MFITRKTIFIAGILVVAVSIVGVAYANNGNDTIYACVNPAGQIRVVGGPGECKSQETNLEWNKVGLQGPQGDPGPSGADGTSCSVNQYEGYAEILCDDGTSATINDGQDGQQGPPGPPGPSQFPSADFDSGWLLGFPASSIPIDHNLGTTNIFVYLIGRRTAPQEEHPIGVFYYPREREYGAYWVADTDNRILVITGSHDSYYEEIRVIIWKLPEPPQP